MKTYLVTNLGKPIGKHRVKVLKANSKSEAMRLSKFHVAQVQHVFQNALFKKEDFI